MVVAHGLRLPVTFTGDLPCADCEAIRFHLDLWPDQAFALRRTWLGTTESLDTLGRWSVDPERPILELWDVGEGQLHFEILNDRRLRQLDAAGRPIDSDLHYELTSEGAFTPIDPLHVLVSGMYVYLADSAQLSECRTGRSYPVAMAGDYARLERAYLDRRQSTGQVPGEPLMVTFEGSIEEQPRLDGGGTEATALVERFINAWPDETCEPTVPARR